MRNWSIPLLLSLIPAGGWAIQPDQPRPLARGPLAPVRTERLLPTPPAIIRFGWTASDVADLVAGLRASTQTTILSADRAGVLEFVCSPDSILSWGTPLFRIYDLDLLGDLTRAQEFAALIGSRPFVVAPRDFPAPLSTGTFATAPPPPAQLQLPAVPEVSASAPVRAQPIGSVPRPASRAVEPERTTQPPPPPPRPEPQSDPAAVQAAADRLAAAEERVTTTKAALAAAQADLRSAQQAVAPLREDVAARRRLLEAGVIARNDVKAAEERLQEAEAAVSAASGAVAEAQSALDAAEAARDAALAAADKTRATANTPTEEPPAVVSHDTPRLAPPPPPRRVQPPPAPPSRQTGEFPPPVIATPSGAPAALPPAPNQTLRLARQGDLPDGGLWGPLPWPTGSAELARQRWVEVRAPWQCVVSQALAPQGAIVEKGRPIIALRPTSAARLTAEVAEEYVGFCRVGAAVKVEFPTYGVAYIGWVSAVEPTHSPRPPGARVEMLLVQAVGGDRPVYRDLEWMALSSAAMDSEPLAYRPPETGAAPATYVASLFPLPQAPVTLAEHAPPDGQLRGRPELYCSERAMGFGQSDPVAQRKLERLREWHDSFIEGMKTTVFPESGLTLTYPREGEICTAVERLATRRVSHAPNMCARTLAEALGWGLGDAAMWATGLPARGYKLREDGIARPGDILVWPFTYGPRRSQHVGIAVGQAGTVMLLSNLEGVLGTQPLSGGYLAFYKPPAKTAGAD